MTLDRVIAVRTAKTVYRDGDLCIKVFNEEFSKADVLKQKSTENGRSCPILSAEKLCSK